MGGGSSRRNPPPPLPTYDAYGGVAVPYYPWKVTANNLNDWLNPAIRRSSFQYRPITSSGYWDPAWGCDKKVVADYTCGKKK